MKLSSAPIWLPSFPFRRTVLLVLPLVAALLAGCDAKTSGSPEAARNAEIQAAKWQDSRDPQAGAKELAALGEALRLWEEAGDRVGQARVLNRMGEVQEDDDEEVARVSYQRSLALATEAGDLREQATALNNLGSLEAGAEKAIEHHRRALALWRQVEEPAGQARALYGLGNRFAQQGNLDAALRNLQDSLPLRRQAGEACGEMRTLLQLFSVHLFRGERDLAQASLEQAELRAPSCDEPAVRISSLMMTIQMRRFQSRTEEALVLTREALNLCRTSGDRREADFVHSMGSLYLDLGEPKKALEHYQEALTRASDEDSKLRIRNSLGWSHYMQRNTAKALEILRQTLEMERQRERQGEAVNAAIRAGTLRYLGVVLTSLGRAKEGLPLLQEELAIWEKGRDRSQEAKSRAEIGVAYSRLGDPERAEKELQRALELARQTGPPAFEAEARFQLARTHRDRGNLPEARREIEEALRIVESVRGGVVSDDLRTSFLASKRAYYQLYLDLLVRQDETSPGAGRAAALQASETARARGLLDLLSEASVDVQQGIEPDLKEREKKLSARLAWLQNDLSVELTRPTVNETRTVDLRRQIGEIGDEMAGLESEIRQLHPRYAQVRYPAPLDAGEIRSLLDGRTALLEYFIGEESSFLFVVTRESVEVHRLPLTATEIQREVQNMRTAIDSGGRRIQNFRQSASRLYEVLVRPAEAALRGRPNLLIAPDGALYLLPFEALLTDPAAGKGYADLPYLLRTRAISYIPSASVLEGLREPRPAVPENRRKMFVAFGDPVRGTENPEIRVAVARLRGGGITRGLFDRLPETTREVLSIAQLFPGQSLLYLQKDATEENVKDNEAVKHALRLHFATHGTVDEEHPRLSGLVMSQKPGSSEDGLLQFYEIFDLQLSADLVTLSACETALGEQVTGEGMIGLTRAFLYAGARSLVVSLWDVNDKQTSNLMIDFYRHLDRFGKGEALRRSKLEMIRKGELPSAWAPFILSGDPK